MKNKVKDLVENKETAILLCKLFIPIILIMVFINRWAFAEQFQRFSDVISTLYNADRFGFFFWGIVVIIFLIILAKLMKKYASLIEKWMPKFEKLIELLYIYLIMFTCIGTILFLMMLGSIEYYYPTNGTTNFINAVNISLGDFGVSTAGKLYLSGYNHHWSMDVWMIIFAILILITYYIAKDIFKNEKDRWFNGFFSSIPFEKTNKKGKITNIHKPKGLYSSDP
jgi:hypothetical protein